MVKAVDKTTGSEVWMNSSEWRTHLPDNEKYDYDVTQFNRLDDAHETNWTVLRIAKERYNNDGANSLIILTARSSTTGPKEFLDLYNMPDVKVYAIGPEADGPGGKAAFLETLIDEMEISSVRYFEDSDRQIRCMKALSSRRHDVKFTIIRVVMS